MPKSPSDSSDSSSSDSGSEDRSPPPKKSKPSGSSKSEKKEAKREKNYTKDEDGNPTWDLGNKRFLKVRDYKGKVLIDVREYYESDGQIKPGRRGLSMTAKQWEKLAMYAKEVDEAIKKA